MNEVGPEPRIIIDTLRYSICAFGVLAIAALVYCAKQGFETIHNKASGPKIIKRLPPKIRFVKLK